MSGDVKRRVDELVTCKGHLQCLSCSLEDEIEAVRLNRMLKYTCTFVPKVTDAIYQS